MENWEQNRFYAAVFVVLILVLTGCADTVGEEKAFLSSSSWSYRARENMCDTGYHEFSTYAEFCSGLQSRVLNNYCAESARRMFFTEKSCPGTFTPF